MVKTKTATVALLAVVLLAPDTRADEVFAPALKSIAIRPIEDAPIEVGEETAEAETAGALEEIDEAKVEVIRTRYPNRKVKIERQVSQDKEHNYFNHGSWTMWSPEGEILGTGQYRWGKRQGSWTRLFTGEETRRQIEKGQQGFEAPLVSKADFVDGEIHGTWLIVDAKNRKVRSWQFNQGALTGEAVAWYPSGARKREARYENGVPNGELREWAADGKLVKHYQFQNGQRLAPFMKRYDSGGVEMEGHYLLARDVLNIRVDWWQGVVGIEVSGKDGKDAKHGKWTHYYQDGGKAYEGLFANDRPKGEHFWWFPNGQKQIQGAFSGGKPDGHWVWWHETGLKKMDGHYVEGVQDKTWLRWAADGKVAQVEEHSLGDAPTLDGEQAEDVEVIAQEPRNGDERTATRTEEQVLPLKPAARLRR